MKRTRITAILTALSLMVSGLPMTSVYAAELPDAAETVVQEEAEGDETPAADPAIEETDGKEKDSAENELPVEQEKDTQDENDVTDALQQGDPEDAESADETGSADEAEESRLNAEKTAEKKVKIAENVKMAGSNGILYEDVAYLSAGNVLAMDEEMQEIYRDLCDEVAESKESGLELQDVVFAVDANGDLYYSFYIPMTALEEIQDEMLPDTDETLTPETEASETAGDDRDAIEEENKDEEITEGDRDAAEEEKNEETAENDKDAAEEKKDDETSEDSKDAEEEERDAEASEDDADASEEEQDTESVEDGQDVEEENGAVSEENYDMLPEMEEETFEEIESVRIESTIDLGYDSIVSDGFGAGGIQFNSILPKTNYFESQLTAAQKKYYGYLKGKLLSGSNKVSFKDSRSARYTIVNDMAHATSALILSYPDKTDWLAKPGGFKGKMVYRLGSATANYTFTYDKSKYYSGSVDSKARSQVKTIASQAQQYAADTYPNAPVYGIVKYLDQWACANGYYENMGTLKVTGDKNADKKTFKLDNSQIEALYKVFYNCHSSYGILLNGYGVCESYAKAMSRLLDAVGIPNMYVVGSAGGEGHAWNYVQMPSGSWYLLDSTWNDTTAPSHKTSKGTYVLIANDGKHTADGRHFNGESKNFTFAALAGSSYSAGSAESITLSKTTCDLRPKEKDKLTYKVAGKALDQYGKVSKVWSSSNTKVAKVDQKGNVTAVAPGTAKITFSMAGMSAQCTVSVNQIKAVKSAATNKTSESVSLGNTTQKSKLITLTVDMGASPRTAEWMLKNDAKTTAPIVTCSQQAKKDVVTATAPTVTGNTIKFTVAAVAGVDSGSSKVTVKFGGKTVTVNVNVGTIITKDMFEENWPAGETAAGNKTYVYTGKAIKPTVRKKKDDAYKKVTFKTSYVNNVNAGTAKLVVTGTGKYGGVLEYPFTIKQVDITGADFSKALKSKAYNGGNNPPATVVKLGKKTLKANRDYEIYYNGQKLSVVPAGKYTISVRGIGNYTGTVSTTQPYEVTKNLITKVTAAGSGSVKYTGVRRGDAFTVKIGKNALPASDYTLTWYQGQGKKQSATPMKQAPLAKGKYTAVIKIKGSNLENTAKKTEIKKNFTIK